MHTSEIPQMRYGHLGIVINRIIRMENKMPIKVIIIEHNKNILNSLRMLLNGFHTIELVGVYSKGEIALDEITTTVPDIALVDMELCDMPAVKIIDKIKINSIRTEVIVFTKFDDKEHLFSAFYAGASGYLLKNSRPIEIIEGIEDLYEGGAPMSKRIARILVEHFHQNKIENGKNILLTKREVQILEELATNYSNKEIANRLEISYHTVRVHLKNIYKKLSAQNKLDAINKAKEKRIL